MKRSGSSRVAAKHSSTTQKHRAAPRRRVAKPTQARSAHTSAHRSFHASAPTRAWQRYTFSEKGIQEEQSLSVDKLNPSLYAIEGTDLTSPGVEQYQAHGPLPTREAGIASVGYRGTTVTIYKPCKNAMQNEKNDKWDWAIREDVGRSEDVSKLAGDDYFSTSQFYPTFNTKEAAAAFCQQNEIPYTFEQEPLQKLELRAYADNFKWKGPPNADL